MTVHKQIIRVNGKFDDVKNYVAKNGIETVIKPYQPENNLCDIMFRTSDTNPCLSERLLMDDIDNEIERFKFIYGGKKKIKDGGDRLRDSQFKKDLTDGKTFIVNQAFDDEKNLSEEFLSKAEVVKEYEKAKKNYLKLIDSG